MSYYPNSPTGRRHELDWLRVLAFGLLIFYHIGMYYVADWGWHLKSDHQSENLQWLMLWCNQWRMSLLFLISGSAVAFMVPKMSALQFILNRHSRLLLPLAFGMAVVVVPQVYVEAIGIGLIDPSFGFFRFWSHYLNQDSTLFTDHKTIGSLHLTWNHLWYLIYVFAYSLIVHALYLLSGLFGSRTPISRAVSRVPASVFVVILPIAILMLNGALLYRRFPQTHAFVDDFFNHGRYFLVFCLGFLWVKLPGFWEYIKTIRHFTLIAAIISYATVLYLFSGGSFGSGPVSGIATNFVWSANSWLWILTICGWAQVHFNRSNNAINYLNGGVFCFYILHQTIILILAYLLRDYQLAPGIEALCIIAGTLLGCWLGYEALRRVPLLRPLFGIFKKSNRQGHPFSETAVATSAN
ncbi:acyltransferase-like protein [Alteromonadaceae bacterium 2753L.S.0a.02]|nr:acyltransferase-like protein [Alteromonadaceae bacterium 2753L.S.0a.02]